MSNNLKRDVRSELQGFAGIFDSLRYRLDTHQVWSDFLEMSVCALSLQTEEKRYLEVAGRYTKKDLELFVKLFAEMIKAYNHTIRGDWNDYLGEFHEVVVSNYSRAARGQFFTPKSLCDIMSGFQDQPEPGATISDPSCGSGRCLLSMASHFNETRLKLFGADIDRNACLMACINLLLHGFQGTIEHMDSLNLKKWDEWTVNPYLRIAGVPGIVRPGKHAQFLKVAFKKVA